MPFQVLIRINFMMRTQAIRETVNYELSLLLLKNPSIMTEWTNVTELTSEPPFGHMVR